MNQNFSISGAVLTIRLPAELDHHSAEQLRQEAAALLERRNIRHVRFDFAQTTFMDSSGIGMLIGCYKLMRFTGGTAEAVCVSGRMKRMLELSGIGKVIDIIPTGGEEDAAK